MVTKTVVPGVDDWLLTLREETEIRGADGRVLGYFVPADPELDAFYAEATAHFDPVEMRRRLDTPGPRYTTVEVLEYCRSREST